MSATPVLSALYRYPVKSMRGESLAASPVGPAGPPPAPARGGCGRSRSGHFRPPPSRCGRRAARPGPGGVTLSAPGRDDLFVPDDAFTEPCPTIVWGSEFPAWRGATAADAWISAYLGTRLRFMWIGADTARRVKTAPDVPLTFADGFPLLLIGQASLDALSARLGSALAMARFRPNLVVAGAEPFAEDGWKRIRIGGTTFRLAKPCERCVFTTVDPDSGRKALDQEPLRTLAKFRKTPEGVLFGQNVIAEGSTELVLGMPVEVLE